jgi:hypothetical protein
MAKFVGEIHKIITSAKTAAGQQCLFVDRNGKRCRSEAINSHSLQRSGPLSEISENGHVIQVAPRLAARASFEDGYFQRVGLRKASVFPGFCDEHDSKLFSDIEGQEFPLNQRAALLFSIRAFAKAHYDKVMMYELQKSTLENERVKHDPKRVSIASALMKGSRIAVEEGEVRLNRAFSFLHRITPPNFLFWMARFEKPAPFAIAGAFEPDWSIDKRYLFRKDKSKTKWNTISTYCGNSFGKFVVCFAGTQQYQNHRIDSFLKSISKYDGIDLGLIFSLATANSDNLFLMESWHKSLGSGLITKT